MVETRAGFVGFGEVNSPRELIERKCAAAAKSLEARGVRLVMTAPVSDDPSGDDVARAVRELGVGEFDVLIVCVAGWIPSHAVVGVISHFAHVPMVLWGLAGEMVNGRLVTTADQAGTTALRQVMADMGHHFRYVYDTIDGGSRATRVAAIVRAACASARLRGRRIGMVGYRDMGLYGTGYDAATVRGVFGLEIEHVEMLELAQRAEAVSAEQIATVTDYVRSNWELRKAAAPATLETGARWYLAAQGKASERGWAGVSIIDVDGMKKLAKFPPSMVFMLLADRGGLCTIPENDALGAVTQQIVRSLTGQIGAYFEFYEFMEDRVLMGVPDYVPGEVVAGRVTVDPSAFGTFSEGLLNVSTVKTGRVTICRLGYRAGRYHMHVAGGTAVAPRSWEEAGWRAPAPQLPSLEIVLDCPIPAFAERVLSQHYIVVFGDHVELIHDFCALKSVAVD